MGSTHIFDSVFFYSGENMSVEVRDVLVGEEAFIDEDIKFGSSVVSEFLVYFSDSVGEICVFFVGKFENIFFMVFRDDEHGIAAGYLVEVDEHFGMCCFFDEQFRGDVTEGAFGVVHGVRGKFKVERGKITGRGLLAGGLYGFGWG